MCNLHLPPTGCSKHPSSPELPRVSTGCGRRCSCRSPRRGFSPPDIAANSPFSARAPLWGALSASPLFPSHRARLCAFPAASPATSRARGSAPSPSPRAAHGALRPNHKRFGSHSPARVPGAGKSCLTSILSRYKTRIQKSEPFHWQRLGAARSRPAAPVLVPGEAAFPALLSACFALSHRGCNTRPAPHPEGHIPAPRLLEPLRSCRSPRPSAPASLLRSGELAFNYRVFSLQHYITWQRRRDGRTDRWGQPGCAVPADARPLSRPRVPSPQPFALRTENPPPCGAHPGAHAQPTSPTSSVRPSAGCGGQNAPRFPPPGIPAVVAISTFPKIKWELR